MFGRNDKTQELKVKIKKTTTWVSYGVLTVIAINYVALITYCINNKYNDYFGTFWTWTYVVIPTFFLALDCMVLLAGLAWICKKLIVDKQFKGNTKWMAAHAILLVVTLISFGYFCFEATFRYNLEIKVIKSLMYPIMSAIV
jgi:hypothetical protein